MRRIDATHSIQFRSGRDNQIPSTSGSIAVHPIPSTSRATESLPSTSRQRLMYANQQEMCLPKFVYPGPDNQIPMTSTAVPVNPFFYTSSSFESIPSTSRMAVPSTSRQCARHEVMFLPEFVYPGPANQIPWTSTSLAVNPFLYTSGAFESIPFTSRMAVPSTSRQSAMHEEMFLPEFVYRKEMGNTDKKFKSRPQRKESRMSGQDKQIVSTSTSLAVNPVPSTSGQTGSLPFTSRMPEPSTSRHCAKREEMFLPGTSSKGCKRAAVTPTLGKRMKLHSTPTSNLETGEQPSEEESCKIMMLDDDCFTHILSFLTHRDLIRVERVCKWWQQASKNHWRTVQRVSIPEIVRVPREDILKCILERCGSFVKFLSVDLHLSNVQTILQHCTRLQGLDIRALPSPKRFPRNTAAVTQACNNLKELAISCDSADKILTNLCTMFANLQSLKLCDCKWARMCFGVKNFQKSLERLEISGCKSIRLGSLITSCRRIKKLKALCFNDTFGRVKEKHFTQILGLHIECLSLTNCRGTYSHPERIPIPAISRNLVSFDANRNGYMDDRVIHSLIANCLGLESLNISGCFKITHEGLSSLVRSKLPLKVLSMCNMDAVSDDVLKQIALRKQLVKLEVTSTRVTDEGCCRVISLCKDLEYLNLCGCSRITDVTIHSAVAAVKYRDNKKLELSVGGTSVSPLYRLKKLNPLLILHF